MMLPNLNAVGYECLHICPSLPVDKPNPKRIPHEVKAIGRISANEGHTSSGFGGRTNTPKRTVEIDLSLAVGNQLKEKNNGHQTFTIIQLFLGLNDRALKSGSGGKNTSNSCTRLELLPCFCNFKAVERLEC